MINKFFKKIYLELVRKENRLILIGLVLFLIYARVDGYYYRKAINENKVTIEAEIIGAKGCFKNGKCIDFMYEYNGIIYKEDARVIWSLASWCEQNNNCKGMKYKIDIQKDSPENCLTYWEDMYFEKSGRKKRILDY